MTHEEWQQKLETEGYQQIYVHTDPPHFEYPEHEHPVRTAHIILAGGMTIWEEGRQVDLKMGDRYDVVANALHEAKMGPEGCTYMIGIRT